MNPWNVTVKMLDGAAVFASTMVVRSLPCICSQRLQPDRFVQHIAVFMPRTSRSG